MGEELAVRWNPISERWQIMRPRVAGQPPNSLVSSDIFHRDWWRWVCVWTVQGPGGEYRDLDSRLIHAMRHGDAQRRDWREILQEMEKRDRQKQEGHAKDLAEVRRAAASALYSDVKGKVSSGVAGVFTHRLKR